MNDYKIPWLDRQQDIGPSYRGMLILATPWERYSHLNGARRPSWWRPFARRRFKRAVLQQKYGLALELASVHP